MKNAIKRSCVNTKDVKRITGFSIRQARNIINDAKLMFKKERKHLITATELSIYLNIPSEEIEKHLS